MKNASSYLGIVALTATVACSGLSSTGGSRLTPAIPSGGNGTATNSGSGSASKASVSVKFSIKVPRSPSSSAKRRMKPFYISSSTLSATIVVTPSTSQALPAAIINCTAGTCAGTVSAPVGSDTFAVSLYDEANGTGNLLSAGSTTATIVQNQANSVNVTFNPVVASFQLSIPSNQAAPPGTAATIPISLNALDADNNTIIGPGTYIDANSNPLTFTLSDSDTSGATSLSTTSVSDPNTIITLSYSGATLPTPAEITASLSNLPSETLLFPALYSVIHNFGANQDGYFPTAGVINVDGTIFGTTFEGGTSGKGTVFSITPTGIETVLHSFSGGLDGSSPSASLTNVNGTLYGTTVYGGTSNSGTVFSITPAGIETVLYSFSGASDGSNPYADLINVNGTLYGTTSGGGTNRDGIVFSITPGGAETVLHSFGSGSDGAYPIAGLTNVDGMLYGTTGGGGASNNGTVFSISLAGAEDVLYSFHGSDGSSPEGGLTNVSGTLYGTTSYGGANDDGTIFSITLSGSESVMHSFGSNSDGARPLYDRLTDVNGILYGTTFSGGSNDGGSLFSITLSGTETVLYSFGPIPAGSNPIGGLANLDGTLFGATSAGGGVNGGTVFSLQL